jgi:phage-related protein
VAIVKPVRWVGSSLKGLLAMPEDVKDQMGFVLSLVQEGESHSSIKSLTGVQGAYEIVASFGGDAYRVVFLPRLPDAIYVLHVFKKKSHRGKMTPQREMELVRKRLKRALEASDEQSRRSDN